VSDAPLRQVRSLMLEDPDGTPRRWRFQYAKKVLYQGKEWGGLCVNGQRLIRFCTLISRRRAIEVRIHEGLHQTYPDLSEDAVKRGEDNLMKLLEASGALALPPKRRR